jgi:hypothetical protein
MPSVLSQLDNDSIVLMYLAGELPPEDVDAVERMLANDAGMREKLDALRLAHDDVTSALAQADGQERVALPVNAAARRVGQAARAWHARRALEPQARGAAAAAGRSLRFPWWCYPVASVAAVILAAVSWWGFQPDTTSKYLAPVGGGPIVLVGDDDDALDGDGQPAATSEDISPATWETYAAVSGREDPAERRLDEAEDELYAMLFETGREGAGDGDASSATSIFFNMSETDEQ